MNREQLAQIATRVYPEAGRAQREDELVGTLLDAGEDSRAAFAGQLGSVVAAGLVARSRAALSEPLGQIGMSALAWAAVMIVAQVLAVVLGLEVRLPGAFRIPAAQLVPWVLPAVILLVMFTLRLTRISGLVGLALTCVAYLAFRHTSRPADTVSALFVLPFAGFALLACAPRKVSVRGGWLWLAPAGVFAFFDVTAIGIQSGVGYIAAVVVAMCFLPFKPSFGLGTVLAWSAFGALELATRPHVTGPFLLLSVVLLAGTPIAVIAVSSGRIAARRI